MYFIEFLIKKFKEIKNISKFRQIQEEEPEDDCTAHIYLPIDSTKKVLACKNCGRIIKNSYPERSETSD